MQGSSIQQQHWISKRVAGDCGANAILLQRRQKSHEKCPFCSDNETPLHVYQCKHDQVQSLWDAQMEGLRGYLIEAKTDPAITTQLCLGMNSWRKEELQEEHDMIGQQTLIGSSGGSSRDTLADKAR
jgi:hypothetical protein